MRFKYLNSALLSMYLLSLFWTAGTTRVAAQSEFTSTPFAQQEIQNQPEGQSMPETSLPATQKNQFKAWFNRTGSGLIISLTPFATAVTLAVLLLIIFVPILIGAISQKRSRGYFKTIPHVR